jgi:hypothetical protein
VDAEAPTEHQLSILRYVRDHGGASAAAIARDVLRAPVTTFGRPVRLAEAETALADLVERRLLEGSRSGRRIMFTLTVAGRRLIRDASLGPPHDDRT